MTIKSFTTIVLAASVILVSCNVNNESSGIEKKPVMVQTQSVELSKTNKQLKVSGNIEGNKTVRLGFLVAGKINFIAAQEFMSLERAREMALAKNEDIKIAEARAQKAKSDQIAARTNYLPKISAEASGMYLSENIVQEFVLPTAKPNLATGELTPNVMINPETGLPITGADGVPIYNMYAYLPLEISLQGAFIAGIKLEQPLFTGGKIIAGNKMADIGVQMSAENNELKKMEAINEVDKAFWLYVSIQSKVKLVQSSLDMLESLKQRVQNSYEAGLATRNDVLKVQVEYDRATLDIQKAKRGLELARMSLCRITGLDFSTPIATDSTIIITDEIIQQYGSEDVTVRPEYKLLEKSVVLEKQKIKMIRADYLPLVGVNAGYDYLGGIKVNSVSQDQDFISVMVNVKIPLFNWTEGMHKIASAKALKSIKDYELEKYTGLMRLEIENAKLNLLDAAFRIKISESSIVQATENLKVSNDNYQVGREMLTDLLIAQAQWEKAYNELIEAKTAYKLQETEYLRVTAKLL